jgi:hypothetical protein
MQTPKTITLFVLIMMRTMPQRSITGRPLEAASLLRTAPPVEEARSLIREGPGPSTRDRIPSHVDGRIRGAFHEEDHMTTTIIWAMALVAMSCTIWTVNIGQQSTRVPQHRGRR